MRVSSRKLVTTMLLVSFIAIGLMAPSVFAQDLELSDVYHVYVNEEHAGIVEDKSVVENFKNELIDSQQQEDNFTYIIEEEINFVSEMVFSPKANNQAVLDYLEEELTIAVEAEELVVGEEIVGYFENHDTAEEVIQAYKEQYVDADILEELENDSTSPAEELTVGDSVISDVSLTKDISIEPAQVKPAEILSVEEGLTLLKKGTLEDKKHIVDAGDVLGTIAEKYDLTVDKLLELNSDLSEDSYLQIGDELHVTAYEPYVEVVVLEENVEEEEIAYETEHTESENMYKGEKEIKQEGENGKAEIHYQTKKVNGSTVNMEVVEENITKEPTKKIVVEGSKVVSSRGSGDFQWPAVGGYISSHVGERWGKMHKGIDIAGVSNRSIKAADNGTVVSAGWDNGGYGNKIIIDHNNGYRTIYAHLASIDVSSGQVVEGGQKIGVMGTTGFSTGIHLHFEIYKNGSLVNPAKFY